jgi:hypothetical protein
MNCRRQAFFGEREADKTKLYTRVVWIGLMICGIGVALGVSGLVVWYSSEPHTAGYALGATMAVAGTLGFSTGVSLISTVPTAEFDIDERRKQRPKLWGGLQFTMGSICVGVSVVFCTFFPYVTAVPSLIAACLIMLHGVSCVDRRCSRLSELHFTTKMAAFPATLFLPLASLYFTLGLTPQRFSENLVVGDLWESWVGDLENDSHVTGPLYSVVGTVYAAGALFTLTQWCFTARTPSLRVKGWRTG